MKDQDLAQEIQSCSGRDLEERKHWYSSADVGYLKAARSLRENGCLILLWNKELQLTYKAYQCFRDLYQAYAPSLERYENQATQEQILYGLGSMMTDSGLFGNVQRGQVKTEVTYTADEYLTLLNTYSPYLKLDPERKQALFTGLRDRIEQNFGGNLVLSYLSAFHIAQPIALHS